MAWDHPTGLATAEIGDGSLNGLSLLLRSDLSKSQTPFVKVWATVPFTTSSNAQGRRVRSDALLWMISANLFTSLPAADLLLTVPKSPAKCTV